MNLAPGGNFQKTHIQDLQLFDTVPAYGVPIAQPPLSTSNPAKAPTSCSLADPTQPCMPQAVQVGMAATVRVLGQGLTSPTVRRDGQTSVIPPAHQTSLSLTPTHFSHSSVDATI